MVFLFTLNSVRFHRKLALKEILVLCIGHLQRDYKRVLFTKKEKKRKQNQSFLVVVMVSANLPYLICGVL